MGESPTFETEEEFLEWARVNWPPDSQFCPRHWAPFALETETGGLLFSMIYVTDVVLFDEELARRAGGDPGTAMKLAAPYCCHYGEETYGRVMGEATAPSEWLAECLLDPRPGGPTRKCKGVLHDRCRDARFAPGNDQTWGEGNWVRCPTCPHDSNGAEIYHHKDAHG